MSAAPIPVFAGPSLWGYEGRLEGFDWRPPAQAGDLIALLEDPPAALCLIDGLFDSCAAPWHKELLLLMAAGTRVYGASSMGALRAAELECFGMTGVGDIYAAYRDGRLAGDDEVALVHATESWRWKPLTVPMVEVRATLVAARRAGLLRPGQARLVRQRIHDIHYDARDWQSIREACVANRLLTKAEAEALEALHVPLKRLDAVRCLELALAGDQASAAPPPPVTFFIRQLASQRGVSLALPPVPSRPG
jgi:hypothetical protein